MEKTSEISPMAGDSTEELRESMVRYRVLFAPTDTHDTQSDDVLDLSDCWGKIVDVKSQSTFPAQLAAFA